MRRFHVGKVVLVVLFSFVTIASMSAVTPDAKLLSLVPPAAHVVAGMSAPMHGGQPSSFLLITHNNLVDLNDFIALSGADGSRVLEQVIMISSEGLRGATAEHSLLASGHFDQALVLRSAYRSGGGANATEYRGIPILAIQPFARERGTFNDVRWLAMMDSNLALFGTIASVQQELDRYLARSVADPSLVRKLARLRRDDATWCVTTLPDHNNEIQSAFETIDSRLADILRGGDTIQFGIHYGRQVDIEYEVGMTSSPGPEAVSSTLVESLKPLPHGSSVLPAADLSTVDGGVRGVLKLSTARYEAWTGEIVARTNLRVAAGSSSR